MNKKLFSSAMIGAHDTRDFKSYEQSLLALEFVALSFLDKGKGILTWLIFSSYPTANFLGNLPPESLNGQDSTLWPLSEFLSSTSLGGSLDPAVDEDLFADFNKSCCCYNPQTKVYSDFPGYDEASYIPDTSTPERFYNMSSANLDPPQWASSQFLQPTSLRGSLDLAVDKDPFADFDKRSYYGPQTKTYSEFPGYDEASYIPDTSIPEHQEPQWPSSQFLQPTSLGGSPDLAADEDASTNTSKSQNPTQWVPEDINQIGYQDEDRNWRCKYSGCISNQVFIRACDLRKHFRAHQKLFFCDHFDCPQFEMGFSSSKYLQRHRNSHSPQIQCEELGCDRVFSRKGMLEIFFALIKLINDID
jgi:hypothetical protein